MRLKDIVASWAAELAERAGRCMAGAAQLRTTADSKLLSTFSQTTVISQKAHGMQDCSNIIILVTYDVTLPNVARVVAFTEYTQSGNGRFLVYISIKTEKSALAGEGEGLHAHPLSD